MKRYVAAAAIFVGVVGVFSQVGCASTGVGDPCTPESEFDPKGGGAELTDLGVSLNSTQCDTRVCIQHFFQGRVTCPYGNGYTPNQQGECKAVDGYPGLYTIGGAYDGSLCCPVVGDTAYTPIALPFHPQCEDRSVQDSVYCSCRCDVPSTVDKNTVKLCECPDGYACIPLFNNPQLPLGKQGSYCVKKGAKGSDLGPDSTLATLTAACGPDKKKP